MRTTLKTIAVAVAFSTSLVGVANADLIAGWDFSQYRGDGALNTMGGPNAVQLPANYSDQDPTNGSGAESAAFGTMYLDGTFGSSGDGGEVLPTSAPVAGNHVTPPGQALNGNNPPRAFPGFPAAATAFNDYGNLLVEGPQVAAQQLALTAVAAASPVFEVDANPDNMPMGEQWNGWTVSFSGQVVEPGGDSMVNVFFAPNCGGFPGSPVGWAHLTDQEQEFVVFVGGTTAPSRACVRLDLNPANGQPVIDNVAITAALPEPGSVGAFAAGALCLLGLARRRMRRA